MDKIGFIKYLESKNLVRKTITSHVKYVDEFFKRTQKEDIQITKPDVLKFLEYLKNGRKLQNMTRYHYLNALNHYFTFLHNERQIAENPCWFIKLQGIYRKNLYRIYTPEELEQFFDTYYQLFVRDYEDKHMPKNYQKQSKLSKERNALALSILFNQGFTTTEIEKIELNDINLMKATIKVHGNNRLKGRTLPLKATQIGLFMHYIQNIRPQLLEYHATETNKLFLPLSKDNKKGTDHDTMNYAFFALSNILKSIDRHFVNMLQVRASLISYWIKTYGLRKAQYMAGHRYVSSTENYVVNNIDGLIDDINKLHPLNF